MPPTSQHPTKPGDPQTYTAAQIANGLGVVKRSISHLLEKSLPDALRPVRGNKADTWRLCSLPGNLQERLEVQAARRGYHNVEQLLSEPDRTIQPRGSLDGLPQEDLDLAARLKLALAPTLKRMNDLRLTPADIERMGIADYEKIFAEETQDKFVKSGRAGISAKQWKRLLDRVIERDCGQENYERLELYLEKRPYEQFVSGTVHGPVKDLAGLGSLRDLISKFGDIAKPTLKELDLFWHCTFKLAENQAAAGKPFKKAKCTIVGFVFANAPFVAGTKEGMRKEGVRRQFERKYILWTQNGRTPSAVTDRRHERSGNRKPPVTQNDFEEITARAVVNHGGNANEAYKEARADGTLSGAIMDHRRADHIPRAIQTRIRAKIDACYNIHHGPRQARLNGPRIDGIWDREDGTPYVYAGDYFQGDDVTLPVVYCEPDDAGWFTLHRGQCLVMIDFRSRRILDYCLLSSRGYNSLDIRSLMTKACDNHGLPRWGFYFERGIWKKANIITGGLGPEELATSDAEFEAGLLNLGFQFIHAEEAPAKPIERVNGEIQDLMFAEPGYVGRDEKKEKFERVQRDILDVKSKKIHPVESGKFYTGEQWFKRLGEIFDKHNERPKGGKMTRGLSPSHAFAEIQDKGSPLQPVTPEFRHLVSHHRKEIKITAAGIRWKDGFVYYDESIALRAGERVLAWFNSETPELLCITDMNRKNLVIVPRLPSVPRIARSEEDRELLTMVRRTIRRGNARVASYYGTLKERIERPGRKLFVSSDTAELGAEFKRQGEAFAARQKNESALAKRAVKASQTLGVSYSAAIARDPVKVAAREKLAEDLDSITTEQRESP